MQDTNNTFNSDLAEIDPDADLFDFSSLAKNIANGICHLSNADGLTLSVNGEWGSGKTTMANFIRHYVKKNNAAIEIIDFNPWWFSTHEDIVAKLFEEIARTLKPTSQTERKLAVALAEFAETIDSSPVELKPSIFGVSLDLKKIAKLSAEKLRKSKSIPEFKIQISELIVQAEIKFLIVIDDVDRLTSQEIRDLLRAIKAVGNLPSVVYLVVADHTLMAEALDEKFPGRGTLYLEKILQVSFDIPPLNQERLSKLFASRLDKLLEKLNTQDQEMERFWPLYTLGINKILLNVRRSNKLLNSLQVTLPSVDKEVDKPDFIAIECLRLFRPSLYRAIRDNKDYFTRIQDSRHIEPRLTKFHKAWLADYPKDDWLQQFMEELFPSLRTVFSNINFGSDSLTAWRQQLRVCSPEIFDIYFRFGLSQNSASVVSADKFLLAANNDECREFLKGLITSKRKEDKEQLWGLVEKSLDRIGTVLEQEGAASIVEAFINLWPEYVDLDGIGKRRWPLDNISLLTRLLSLALKICESNRRDEIIWETFTSNELSELTIRLMQSLGREHGYFEGAKQEESEVLTSHGFYDRLSETIIEMIQKAIDRQALTDIRLISLCFYFVSALKPAQIPSLVGKLRKSLPGLVAIISQGLRESYPLGVAKSLRTVTYEIDLPTVSQYVDINDVPSMIANFDSSKLDERSLRIIEAFEENLANYKKQ